MCIDIAIKKVVPKYCPSLCSKVITLFKTLGEFNIAEAVLVYMGWYVQTPPVLTVCPANSCPLFVLMVIFAFSFQRFNLWDSAPADIFRGLDGGRNKCHLPY